MQFPDGGLRGKGVPESGFRVGCGFPMGLWAETASHSMREFWDGFSAGGGCCHANWGGICTVCKNETRILKNETVDFCPFGVAFERMSHSIRVK